MKAIKFKVNRKGNGYVATALVPANHSESAGVSKLGVELRGPCCS